MIKKYRKKPVVIRALQWTGDNYTEILNFCDKAEFQHQVRKHKHVFLPGESEILEGIELTIETLEGTHEASIGDYIIEGVNGEFYPCKPDIFEKTYEEVN